uniref:RNA polymerase sigma factor region1.1 domain-containing protein n=1 Tax=uncultured Selenomonas sp. TaxID=159275 RepID=UPI0028D2D65B
MMQAAARKERERTTGTGYLDELMEKGRANGGTLTYSELISALEQREMSPDEMDVLYHRFTEENVEIVDDTAVGESADDEPPELGDEFDKEDAETEVEIDLSVPEGISLDDPV